MSKKEKSSGQSLFEVVVALAVVGLTAIGIVRVSSVSIRNARYANEQTLAVSLAEKKMAELRSYAVNEPDLFWALPYNDWGLSENYCYLVEADWPTDESAKLPTTSPRYDEAKIAQVQVYVFWEVTGDNLCSTLETGQNNYNHDLEFETLITI